MNCWKSSPNLALTVDFGWLWLIAKPLYHVLEFIHDFVGNWGRNYLADSLHQRHSFFIFPQRVTVRWPTYDRVAPELTRLKEQYGDDRRQCLRLWWSFTEREKSTPGWLLTYTCQMPVFISLLLGITRVCGLRQAPFSVGSRIFPLRILILSCLYWWVRRCLFRWNWTQHLPILFRLVLCNRCQSFSLYFPLVPAGLVLYWFVNNLLSIAQQWIITRKLRAMAVKPGSV